MYGIVKKIILAFFLLAPSLAFAAPSSVDRITDHIEPLIRTDYIKAPYFFASTTLATSTLKGALYVGNGRSLTDGLSLLVGSTTPNNWVLGDIFRIEDKRDGFIDGAIQNSSTGPCATAEWDAQSNSTSLTNFFSAFGHTGSGFTGSGCTDTPYTDFGSNSTYILNPNGNINFALGTTSTSARFAFYGAGYTDLTRLMTLTQPGRIGLGTNNPDSQITISSVGPTTAIVAPQAGTMIHLASSGAQNARITGDVYTNGTTQGFVFQGRKSRGGVGSPTAVNADDTLAVLGGVGYGTTGFPNVSAGAYIIRAEASGTDTSQPTYLSLFTTAAGSITPSEKLRINSRGAVGISTTSPFARLSVQNVYGTGSTTLFAIASSTASTGASADTVFSITTSGSIFTKLADGCVQASGGTLTSTGSACGAGGGGTDTKWATSTLPLSGIYPNSATYVGIGTTTPRFNLQLATSTAPQLTLTGSQNSAHWTFNNINGNLFLATSSPVTLATSTGGTNNSIQFPANGGCVGCSDIIFPGGINLRNGKYVSATSTSLLGNTFETIYTAPTGRRALVLGFSTNTNASTSAITISPFLLDGGSYYKLTGTSTAAANSRAGASIGYILEPGQSVALLASAIGLAAWINIVEYDSSTAFRSITVLGPTNATTTLYTVPANTSALITTISPVAMNAAQMAVINTTIGTVTYRTYVVKSGDVARISSPTVAGNDTQNLPGATIGANILQNASLLTSSVGGGPLNSGDSIQFWFNTAMPLSPIWINVYER